MAEADYGQTDYFMDRSLVDDPYPYFEWLRAQGPLVSLPAHDTVAVVGFEEALAIYLDTEHFSSANTVTGPLPPLPFAPEGDDITDQIEAHRPQMPFGEEVLTLDAPRHGPIRALLMGLFTPRRLAEMEPAIRRIADGLIDEFAGDGMCEFSSRFASPFAMLSIAELLGVPDADRAEFRAKLGPPPSQVGVESSQQTVNPFDFRKDKFLGYIEDRRRTPRGDIMSTLANATYADGSIPKAMDVVHAASMLFGAGQDTTAHLLGGALRILAERQDIQAELRADPARIPSFIEEVLRHSGPVKSGFRLVRRSTSMAGVDLPAGTCVMMTTAAINRDPRRFDDPGIFRLGRPAAKEHLSFGRGAHTCPGAALARTEARIALEQLLARFGAIGLDEAHHGPEGARRFSYAPTYVFRMLRDLHLTLEPAE